MISTPSANSCAFKSKSSKEKAVERVTKALLKSPMKQKAVVKTLAVKSRVGTDFFQKKFKDFPQSLQEFFLNLKDIKKIWGGLLTKCFHKKIDSN